MALCLEKVKTGKTGQKDKNFSISCLELGLVNSTNTYRDLLCARHCATCWGFKVAGAPDPPGGAEMEHLILSSSDGASRIALSPAWGQEWVSMKASPGVSVTTEH